MMSSMSFRQLLDALPKRAVEKSLGSAFKDEEKKDRERMALAMDQGGDKDSSVDSAQRKGNYDLNRYHDVLPFDVNRVQLEGKHDYINASHIALPKSISSNKYIATQGPLSHSVGDFWRMVWEQGSTAIVMLANPVEAGRTKCAVYWPTSPSQPVTTSGLTVTLGSERVLDTCPSVVVRKLVVQNTQRGGSRTVTQLHFTEWPDHGVPQSPVPLLQMVHQLRENTRVSDAPVVVHCSAGVGRTGTFIIIDAAVGYFAKNSDYSGDLVADVFKSLRSQRTLMVQTLSQYMFCYQASFYLLNSRV